jgi:CBS-domain-containing membrane protein
VADDPAQAGGPADTAGPVVVGLWSAALSAAFVGLAGAIGVAFGQPWVFPSLAPSLMVMAETPDEPAARPQNVLIGHLVGLCAGLLALVVTGLRSHPSAVQEGLSGPRVLACCLAVAVTALVLQLARLPHPPAGATTLIVALGVLRTGPQLRAMLLAFLLLTLVAVAVAAVRAQRKSAPG